MGKGLKASATTSDILNYIANENPSIREAIGLPQQNSDTRKLGKIIMSNTRYKNDFINAINVIALTLVVNEDWRNPWEEFTEQGSIAYGTSVREMIVDLVKAQDYNEFMNNETHFLETQVPNVMNYMHEMNFQKFYKITVNDEELARAFYDENTLSDFITACYTSLRKSYKYDKYIVDKYQIQRRIVDGTITAHRIENFDTNDTRDNVAFMKEVSNNMTFLKPNYNPAGRLASSEFSRQRTIISTGLEAQLSTKVLATSYFRNDAEMKTKMAMVDGFGYNDWSRLSDLLKSQYVAFSTAEIESLKNVKAVIIDENFFKDYYYSIDNSADTRSTSFENPESLMRTMWLHVWRIFDTSPFENAVAFTSEESTITSITVSPSTATLTKGQSLHLSATVAVTGIPNKAVLWTVDQSSATDNITINQEGILQVPAGATVATVTVTATSIYDSKKTGTATITLA